MVKKASRVLYGLRRAVMDGWDTEFAWDAPQAPGSFSWVSRKVYHAGGDVREQVLTLGEGAPLRKYRPLQEERGLFIAFAEAETSLAGTLKFADRYGLLGEGANYRRGLANET